MNDGPPNLISSEDRTSAMLAHLLGIITSWVGPLVVYFIKKDKSDFAAFHALQALFFQIAIFALYAIAAATFLHFAWAIIGILNLVFCILAALAAQRGEWYEIPVVGEFARKQMAK